MLLALQFPFADARPFLTVGHSRLSKPSWPLAIPRKEFVRCFGAIHARARGTPLRGVWSEDFYFASASAAIKFPDLGTKPVESPTAKVRPQCAFRRFFCDGGPVSRVEVGLELGGIHAVDGNGLLAKVRDVLKLPTAVTQWEGSPQKQPLVRQGAPLAKLYAQVTTRTTDLKKQMPHQSFVWAGFPVAVVEYKINPNNDFSEFSSLPALSNVVEPGAVGGLSVAHVALALEGQNVGIWMIGCTDQNRDAARRLRLCLLRLYAEQQVLSQTLRWIAAGKLQYKPNTPAGDRLEEYFNRATCTVFQKTRNGVEQKAVQEVMAAYEWVVSTAERDILSQQLNLARRQVRQKLERFTMPQGGRPIHTYVEFSGNIIGGELTIMDTGPQQTVNIDYGHGNNFNGDVIAANNIKDSFINASTTPKIELQEALTGLTKMVAAMAEKLDADTQRQVTRKLKVLTEEATDPKPDKSTLEFSGNGLIEAAKAFAEMVGPVTTAVKGVLSLFGILIL